MLYLLKKELTANVGYMLMGLAIFVIYAFVFTADGYALFMTCLVFSFYMVSSTNMVFDERYKIYLLMSTLPIRRRDIVVSKYLLLIVIFIICFVLYTLLSAGSRAVGYDRIPMLNLVSVTLGLFAVSFFNIIMLPLSYRYGAQAAQYVSLVMFVAIFFLSPLIGKIDFSEVLIFYQKLNDVQLSLFLLGGAVVVNIISYLISCSIYEKKDFK